jgi:hypothetical protein
LFIEKSVHNERVKKQGGGGKKKHLRIEEDKVYVEVKWFCSGFHFLLNRKFTV